MVKSELSGETKCYYCEECEMFYLDKKKASECEEWCKKHISCNLGIIKHSMKIMETQK